MWQKPKVKNGNKFSHLHQNCYFDKLMKFPKKIPYFNLALRIHAWRCFIGLILWTKMLPTWTLCPKPYTHCSALVVIKVNGSIWSHYEWVVMEDTQITCGNCTTMNSKSNTHYIAIVIIKVHGNMWNQPEWVMVNDIWIDCAKCINVNYNP